MSDDCGTLLEEIQAERNQAIRERDAALHDVKLWKRQNTMSESALDDCRRLLDEARAERDAALEDVARYHS